MNRATNCFSYIFLNRLPSLYPAGGSVYRRAMAYWILRSEPETYDRLVDAFLNTDSESIRRRIATRLHSSRNSDHPLARFYANRAIERLVDAGEEEALESVMSQIGAE